MADDTEQCRALTEGGERCSRPARENGLCHQHDEDDPTVDDESDGSEESSESGGADGTDSSTDEERESEDMNEDTDESDTDESDTDESGDADGDVGLIEIRDTVRANATALIGHPLDAVVAIGADGDDGWRAVVEVVERSAVPDTEDILGRYEVYLDDGGNFQRYGRLDRYRRADTDVEAV
ncbi:gas vesicle protein GvpO, halophile-type [Halomarina litorea]|uniref:gas vesicle protein GvpO, halophile-type n=1 Tax=Halomarina litorea TaxID=2961595 RepID=UPI0026E55439|nr:gas vesicle protein GvpO [Halomarina sp. BCD28]